MHITFNVDTASRRLKERTREWLPESHLQFANREDVHAGAWLHLFGKECEQEMGHNEARRRHAEIFGPAGQAGGACGRAEHDDRGIEDFARDIGRSPHAEEDEELPVENGDGAGCGAVDSVGAAGEATEHAPAGTAEVIAQPSRRELSFLRMLCSGLLSKPPPVYACDGVLQDTTVSTARWQVCLLECLTCGSGKRCLVWVWW